MTPPPRNRRDWALFLDVDGTLLEIADTPQAVFVPEALKELLAREVRERDGALALVTGRSLDDVDALFAPLQLAAAGQHGLERRDGAGRIFRSSIPTEMLDQARAELGKLVELHRGLLLEDKGAGLALHYRQAPELESVTYAAISEVAARLPGFSVQPGKCVWELKPCTVSKGSAIRDFMQATPFAGRVPVFLGDDLTDEHGFEAVNELGGLSILVGKERETKARYGLGSVTEVLRWLGVVSPEPIPLSGR